MASTSVRVAAKQRLVELLAVALAPVQVTYAERVSNERQDERVFLGSVIGSVSVRDFRSGRKARDDTFSIIVYFVAGKPQQTDIQADARVEELYGALENLLATNPRLANEAGPLDGIQWAAQLNSDTEFAEPEPTQEGWEGKASAHVQIKTLLT